MDKNNTAKAQSSNPDRIPWPLDDCIRWIEWRVRELTIKNGQYVDERGKWLLEEKGAGGRKFRPGDQVADYAVWLLKLRDGLSWHQIAYRFFPSATEKDIEKYESKVRRIYSRVDRGHPGSSKFEPPQLSEYDKIVLQAIMSGVIPIYLSHPPAETGSELQSQTALNHRPGVLGGSVPNVPCCVGIQGPLEKTVGTPSESA